MKYIINIIILLVLTGCASGTIDKQQTQQHVKTYPLTKLKTTNVNQTVKVLDNDTMIYTEDTGHGIPTKPAGEGHTFHAILKITYNNLSMYMLDDGTFITADPKHVSVEQQNNGNPTYPHYEMHEDDAAYLNSLNKKDRDYKAYERYVKEFGKRQFDYQRELMMHTAINAVNHRTPDSFEIPKESFMSFEAFKQQ